LLFGAPPLLAWLAIALLLDRQFGIRCPHCRRSLTVRFCSHRVLDTGECSLCGARLFDKTCAG
jgi:Zn ribbon nucleic-acid-binding protein